MWTELEVGAYRSITSPVPGQAISSDGWLDPRMWRRIETEMQIKEFWSLEPKEAAVRPGEPVMYLEGCDDGTYHRLQRQPQDNWLYSTVRILARVGKLKWLRDP